LYYIIDDKRSLCAAMIAKKCYFDMKFSFPFIIQKREEEDLLGTKNN
jgi:hypothetical protein